MAKPWSDDDNAVAAAIYRADMSTTDVAQLFGVGRGTISGLMVRMGFRTEQRGLSLAQSVTALTEQFPHCADALQELLVDGDGTPANPQ